MFQFAALKGIARNRGYEYCIPTSKMENEWTDHQLFIPFKLSRTSSLNVQEIDSRRPVIIESSFSFDETLFNSCPDWVNIQGYFQSEKYFKHIESEIRQDFEFRNEILEPCMDMIEGLKSPVSLHVRRTDYVTNPNHSALDLDYYKTSISEFGDSQILIFTDDVEWCNDQELFSTDQFMISESGSPYIDLCLMTLCSGHIIANSSFSWWGAWLSGSKKVIAPKDWFKGSNNEHLDTTDLIPNNWITL